MELLDIETLQVAQGALRHGVLFEMVERDDHNTDTRDVSVQRLAQKFAVDAAQAQRVSKAALTLFDRIVPQDTPPTQRLKRKLSWAAQLHEIGVAISHTDYHKHGAYILDNADLLGFGMQELHRLGVLVLGQRGKLKKLEAEFDEPEFVKLLLVLRIAIILCHARKEPEHNGLSLRCHDLKQHFVLTADATWTKRYPQSAHLLRQESVAWEKTPWSLQFSND
jgi:exopolyphosphatase/guanosine-5'-triphosphate,3'-diphosphate pyrophosphatase